MNAADSTANDDVDPPQDTNAPPVPSGSPISTGPRFESKSQGLGSDSNGDWSNHLLQRFGLSNKTGSAGTELGTWWDGDLWQTLGPGEYRHPATPKSLLSDVPDAVWPPLMPPNFMPLVGNGGGDWLCLRLLDPDVAESTGQRSDVCHWYHGGGDWLPWGDQLSEALLFDWVLPHLPESDRRHADPAIAEFDADPTSTATETVGRNTPIYQSDHPWVQWATTNLPTIARLQPHSGSIAGQLLELGLCEIPVRCQLVIEALNSRLLNTLKPKISHQIGLPWNDLMRWCFDLRELPSEVADRLIQETGSSPADLDPDQQDWKAVEDHATAITLRASDLSWGHDLLGYCRLRNGNTSGAAAAFRRAIRCSVFTDQSVRLRTHWATSSEGVAKFSARFLTTDLATRSTIDHHTDPSTERLGCVPRMIPTSRLIDTFGKQTNETRKSVRGEYTRMLIDASESNADLSSPDAARLIYAAGWDLGAEPMRDYGSLLDRYIVACHNAAGERPFWDAHERLARIHRQAMKARYNL